MNARAQLQHRLQRSRSWLERAASEQDIDTKYILLWIAFNAAYALERNAAKEEFGEDGNDPPDWKLRMRFFEILTRVRSRQIHATIRGQLWNPATSIMKNEYVYWGFWESLTDDRFDWENWRLKRQFTREQDKVTRLLSRPGGEHTGYVLQKMFDRLGVLRNQLMHGCATQQGALNRRQVVDATRILEILVPLFVGVMEEYPDEKWGKISYPVRNDIREDLRTTRPGR